MSGGETILVVDEEPQSQRLLRMVLTGAGFKVIAARGGTNALHQFLKIQPSVVLLDLELPDMDGKDVIGAIRAGSSVPIIVLSARLADTEKVACFELGADDYVNKPFSSPELIARIRAALRHSVVAEGGNPIFKSGKLVIDTLAHRVTVGGVALLLTPREYDLLHLLARNAGHVLTHHQILKTIWGESRLDHLANLRVFVRRIRRKIETNPEKPQTLKTLPGVGYLLDAGPE